MSRSEGKTSKGEQTKERIVEAALALFRDRGYEGTTMRAVAERGGVSLGNAYYYYASKEHLLHAFYDRMVHEQARASERALRDEKSLEKRLLGVLEAKLEVVEPYHRFSALLFKTAADPQSPLNPFHEASADVRTTELGLYQRVIDGARIKVPKDLAPKLPTLLWMYGMSIVLYWIHDASPGRQRTKRLVAHTASVVSRLIRIASNPLLRPLRKSTLKLLEDLGVGDPQVERA